MTEEDWKWMAEGDPGFTGIESCAMTICGSSPVHIAFVDAQISNNSFAFQMASQPHILCVQGKAEVQFVSSVFSGNWYFGRPGDAALVAVDKESKLECIGCKFSDNIGGSALSVWGRASLRNSLFVKNRRALVPVSFVTADPSSGLVYAARSAELTLDSCTFAGNSGAQEGAAVYVEGTASISNCTFASNYAKEHGGAIMGKGLAASVSISGTSFKENFAGILGGAVAIVSTDFSLALDNCSFSSNQAARGGALGLDYGAGPVLAVSFFESSLRINNTLFLENTASKAGSAVYVRFDSLDTVVVNTSFKGNQAGQMGTVYSDLQKGVLELRDVVMQNNSAEEAGGGLVAALGPGVRLLLNQTRLLNNRSVGSTSFGMSGFLGFRGYNIHTSILISLEGCGTGHSQHIAQSLDLHKLLLLAVTASVLS
jgi:predicted outer membrane repeat protein